jgi:hypothetical protein
VSDPSPGDKRYAAHWKKVVGSAGLAGLRRQPEDVSGKSLLLVLKTYGEHLDNATGEAWPSQPALAKESGCGRRTVSRAQALAIRLGFLEMIAAPVPGVRGGTFRALVPEAWETLVERANAAVSDEVVASKHPRSSPVCDEVIASESPRSLPVDPRSLPVEGEVIASTGNQTLSLRTLKRTLMVEATPWPRNSQEVKIKDHLSPAARARVDAVWDEAEQQIATEAVAKLRSGGKINYVEQECAMKWNHEEALDLLTPSFD